MIFFQTYMVAPLFPFLATGFGASAQTVFLFVLAYTRPYALAGLLLGAASACLGGRGMLLASLAGFPLLRLCTARAVGTPSLVALHAISDLATPALL